MHISIDPSSGVPIYLQIIQEIKLLIASGILNSGDKLPSVRNLAVDLRINPNTVSKAYNELEWNKIIYTRRGEGTFVSEHLESLQETSSLEILREKIDEIVLMAHKFGFPPERIHQILDERFVLSSVEKGVPHGK